MELRAGMRLESTTSETQVVVVKVPKEVTDVDLRCGGAPMRPLGDGGDRQPIVGDEGPTLMGKRYADEDLGLEVLCSQAGAGVLTIGDELLLVKGAKPLPSSD